MEAHLRLEGAGSSLGSAGNRPAQVLCTLPGFCDSPGIRAPHLGSVAPQVPCASPWVRVPSPRVPCAPQSSAHTVPSGLEHLPATRLGQPSSASCLCPQGACSLTLPGCGWPCTRAVPWRRGGAYLRGESSQTTGGHGGDTGETGDRGGARQAEVTRGPLPPAPSPWPRALAGLLSLCLPVPCWKLLLPVPGEGETGMDGLHPSLLQTLAERRASRPV